MDVGFQGESGSRSDIPKLSRLTPNGHWDFATSNSKLEHYRF